MFWDEITAAKIALQKHLKALQNRPLYEMAVVVYEMIDRDLAWLCA
jgi:hypothetical protein